MNTVVNRPFGEIGDVQQVGLTTDYKGEHWMALADESNEAAEEARRLAGGVDTPESQRLAELAEDQRAEGMRQITKQNSNQLQPRQDALQRQVEWLKERGDLPANYDPPKPDERLDRAMAILEQTKTEGMSPVDVERQLMRETGMTPRDVSQAAGARLEVMETLRPPEVRDLQRQMDQVADRILTERMADPSIPAWEKNPSIDDVFAAMEAADG